MITQEQYEAIKPIAEGLYEKDGFVDANKLLAEVDRIVKAKKIPPVFTATKVEMYHRYQREVISAFIERWSKERKEYWIGVAQRRTDEISAYYRLEDATKESNVARKARQEYITGLTMLKTYGPYAASWGKKLEDVLEDLEQVREYIQSQWTP